MEWSSNVTRPVFSFKSRVAKVSWPVVKPTRLCCHEVALLPLTKAVAEHVVTLEMSHLRS